MVSPYPVADEKLINAGIEQDMQMVMDLILAIRNIRGEMNIAPSMQITVIVKVETKELGEHLEKSAGYAKTLARIKELRIGSVRNQTGIRSNGGDQRRRGLCAARRHS